jgi:hypothetical protein
MTDVIVAAIFLVLTIVVTVLLIWWSYRQIFGIGKDFEAQDDNLYNLKPDVWRMLEDLDKKHRSE